MIESLVVDSTFSAFSAECEYKEDADSDPVEIEAIFDIGKEELQQSTRGGAVMASEDIIHIKRSEVYPISGALVKVTDTRAEAAHLKDRIWLIGALKEDDGLVVKRYLKKEITDNGE